MHYSSCVTRTSLLVNFILFCVFWCSTRGFECGGHTTQWSGQITSLNYPFPYPSGLDCVWVLNPPTALPFTLRVDDFRLESHALCEHDYLKIRWENSNSSHPGRRYCGEQRTPFVIRAPTGSTGSVRLEFRTDGTLQYTGFRIQFYISSDNCLYHEGALCPSGRCINAMWICDHENDCRDYSDEEKCDGRFEAHGVEVITTETETTDYLIETIAYMNVTTEFEPTEYDTMQETLEYETETTANEMTEYNTETTANEITEYNTETTANEITEYNTGTSAYEAVTYENRPSFTIKATQRAPELHVTKESTHQVEETGETYSTAGIITGVTLAFIIGISMVGIYMYRRRQRRNILTSLEKSAYQKCAESVVINKI